MQPFFRRSVLCPLWSELSITVVYIISSKDTKVICRQFPLKSSGSADRFPQELWGQGHEICPSHMSRMYLPDEFAILNQRVRRDCMIFWKEKIPNVAAWWPNGEKHCQGWSIMSANPTASRYASITAECGLFPRRPGTPITAPEWLIEDNKSSVSLGLLKW